MRTGWPQATKAPWRTSSLRPRHGRGLRIERSTTVRIESAESRETKRERVATMERNHLTILDPTGL